MSIFRWIIYIGISLLCIALEGSVTTIPLLLGWLVCMSVLEKSWVVFLWGFLSGLLLDSVTFHMIGTSSIFFVVILYIVSLYQRKFEIQTVLFVIFATWISSFVYLKISGIGFAFFPAFTNACFIGGVLGFAQLFSKSKTKKYDLMVGN